MSWQEAYIPSKVIEFNPPVYPKRWLFWGKRLAPSFFIIGAQKSGTTSLMMDLVKHPNVLPPLAKELYYFSHKRVYDKGLKNYLKGFPKFQENVITGDATANYFETVEAAKRLKQTYPKAKILVVLRNPTDRAFSHYKMAQKLGYETLDFESALAMEIQRIKMGDQLDHNYPFQRLGYRSKGEYVTYLQAWLEYFPKDQIKIMCFETLFEENGQHYEDVLKFLNLEPIKLKERSWQKKTNGNVKMMASTRLKLDTHFAPYNKELFDLIGHKYPW